ncbi:hypothetical protein DL766_007629 [Monosporascus sp. MC13-8B]|uniref:DUF1690 domain-containing protein n=1 Tax=Monosporascus cannonballus TaxID=155416 RepID=A0ABY0HFH9_9PEZI|nr:hypothetical protein DL762_003215 [Monosporascus cannonballus]RYO99563.1 hypothetical protein DL763_001382 [Monosporascus cannonballus]RYP22786.1 hypothetical protein DL766_007629 [Monosporascus sp. MC13-8B]
MGANSSKSSDQSPHAWKAPGPVSVSQDVVESLQASSESDTSRAQTLELAVQARVAEELRKMLAREDAALKEAQEKASEYAGNEDKGGKSRQEVSKEVETLRARLEKRKQLRQLPDSVEAARGEVVRCLMEHDRRPLDCWKEVETFKEEVRRLEKQWVEKVVR